MPEGKICSSILSLYNDEAIVVEPAGAVSFAALDYYKEEIKGKVFVNNFIGLVKVDQVIDNEFSFKENQSKKERKLYRCLVLI